MTGAAFGKVEIEGDEALILFERKPEQSPERVWHAQTDPAELRQWFLADVSIEGTAGGKIEMVTGLSRFHWTGTVLAWEPLRILEYEARIAPHEYLPKGDNAAVRWELSEADGGTIVTVIYRRLSPMTALGFAPGIHAYLDRLEAQLAGSSLPNWVQRYADVKAGYPDPAAS